MKLAATAAGLCVLALGNTAYAQDNRSLTNSGIRTPQLRAAGGIASQQDAAAPLQERLLLAENSIRALTQSLAIANSEAELFKRQSAELSLKLQTLGLSGIDEDETRLEQRLLGAVRDLRMSRRENQELKDALIVLTETVLAMLATSEGIDPDIRMTLEIQLRKTNELFGVTPGVAQTEGLEPTLSDGMVVDVREDLSLVVANLGDRHGVKIGMPFQVWREGSRIATVKVVDVRDRLSGAIIQNLESSTNPVQAGDRLRVDARQ